MMEQTPILVFTNLVMIAFLYLYTRPAYHTGVLSNKRRRTAIAMSLVFCLFSFWGKDWFGYQGYFLEIKSGFPVSSMEEFYNWLVATLCPNYIVFRFFVWGTALLLFYKTVKLLNLNCSVALFFFCSIYLIWFSYARASLAMSLMFYGCTIYNKHKLKNKLFGIVFIILSYYLHKSALFGIAIIFVVEAMKSNVKCTLYLSIVLFPLLVSFVSSNIGGYMDVLVADEDNMLNTYAMAGNSYLTSDVGKNGPGAILQAFLERFPYYMLAYSSFVLLLKRKSNIDYTIKPFFMILTLLVIFSSVFAFDLGVNTSTLYGRFLRYAQIPSCIVLTYLYSNKLMPKMTRSVFCISVASTVYSLLYVMYNSYVATN